MKNILYILVIKIALEGIYFDYIAPIYGYMPEFKMRVDFSLEKWLMSYLLAILLWLTFRIFIGRNKRVTNFILSVQYLIIVLPSLALFGLQNNPYWHIFLICGSFFITTLIAGVIPVIRVRYPTRRIAYILCTVAFCFIAYVYIGIILTGGIQRLSFNFYDVYSVRTQYEQTMLPGFSYLVPWVAYVINMFLLLVFFSKRNWFGFLIILALQLFLYGATNFKSFLFAPIVAVMIAIAIKRFRIERLALLGVVLCLAIGLLITKAGEPMGIGILSRTFFSPAASHGLYFSYFSTHPFAWMAGSRFADLFAAPYQQSAIELIASYYWTEPTSPNIGWVGDAYAQFGIVGVFIYAIIFGCLLRLADTFDRKLQLKNFPIEAMLVGASIAFCSSALGTVFLTHGFLLILIGIWTLSYFQGNKSYQTHCDRNLSNRS